MGRKKKFIDKKKSATFQLIARDSSDPNYTEGPSGDRVFVRVDGNSEQPFFDEHDGELSDEDDPNGIFDDAPEDYSGEESGGRGRQTTAGRLGRGSSLPDHVRREILELGFPDDGYNYLSHLRDIKDTGGGSAYYQNPKAVLDQLPRDVKAYDASRIEVSKANDENSYKNSIYGVAVNTVPVRIQKAIDPEVAALLDDSDVSRFGSDVEDLEEDFVFNANLPDESEDVELDNKFTFIGETSLNSKKEEHPTHYSQDKIVENSGINEVKNHNLETVVSSKPRERRLLDEQFDLLELQEYGTESEDEFENATSEDDEFHDSLESKLNNVTLNPKTNTLENDENYKVLVHEKDMEEEPVSLETAADLRPRCIEYAEKFENENDKEDVVFEESSSDESEKWDCETIITTYSNLDNHPGKIQDPGVKRKRLTEKVVNAFGNPTHVISLKGKERIPVDFLPNGRNGIGDGGKEKSKVKNLVKPKKVIGQESKEEKKERKAALKEERREARRVKKDMKELYKGEAQQAQKVAAFTPPSSIHLM
ncbi:unnamed protein product [Lactuca saligna]|uniref:Protein LTV1 homolog n=1 Tax=Lactuca saligna TaxID=75948 RepID=A0AA35VJZ2_LACSI|nr:unnamed protein product [Lactuca saligna]